MNKPRSIGTQTESAIVKVLRGNGFPNSERRSLRGVHDAGDVTGTPGIVWECKGGDVARTASDKQIMEWLGETEKERRNAGADVGILVVARKGIGYDNADRWWAILYLVTVGSLLDGDDRLVQPELWAPFDMAPIRLHLVDACELLTNAGYGGGAQ